MGAVDDQGEGVDGVDEADEGDEGAGIKWVTGVTDVIGLEDVIGVKGVMRVEIGEGVLGLRGLTRVGGRKETKCYNDEQGKIGLLKQSMLKY